MASGRAPDRTGIHPLKRCSTRAAKRPLTPISVEWWPKRAATELEGRKLVQLSITVNGSAFSGTITQRTRVGGDAETVLSGTVTGRKTDTTAEFDARFPGLVPNVAVA